MPLPYISESETSSSEAETLRSTPPASPPAFPSNSNSSTASSNDDDVRFQSRKVRRAKKHLLGALVCCYAILAREAGEQVQAGPIAREREPWTSLIVHLKRLPTRAASLESCENVLERLVFPLIALAESREYARSLSKPEAKSLRPFLRYARARTSTASPGSGEDDIGAFDLLSRVATFALTPRRLVLSSLSSSSIQQIPRLTAMLQDFGFPCSEVRRLDLSKNNLDVCPTLPLPQLRSLIVSDNPNLASLPLALLAVPLERVHVRNTQVMRHLPTQIAQRYQPTPTLPNITIRSLRHYAAAVILDDLAHLDLTERDLWWDRDGSSLPEHLKDGLKASYFCELCRTAVFPSMRAWLAEETDLAATVGKGERSKTVRVKGRICRNCLKRIWRPEKSRNSASAYAMWGMLP